MREPCKELGDSWKTCRRKTSWETSENPERSGKHTETKFETSGRQINTNKQAGKEETDGFQGSLHQKRIGRYWETNGGQMERHQKRM